MLKRYGGAAVVLQALLLAGCGGDATPAPQPSASASSVADAAVTRPAGEERLVLAFGDSLYAGYGLDRGEGLPETLQDRLWEEGINATVANAGVSGDTTAAGRQRLAFALDNLPRTPDLVLLGLGGNDALRQIAPAETRANLAAMMAELDERGIAVVLTGMLAPPNLGGDYASQFNAIWPDLARQYQAPLDPFILDGVLGDRRLMLPDGVHPNADGVERIADRVTPIVAKALSA